MESQISNLKLDDDPACKLIGDFSQGKPKIEGEERQIKKAKRTTTEGQKAAKEADRIRKKNDQIFKASLKKKGQDDDSDWESVEEDAPVIQLADLLDNMQIEGDSGDEEEKEEEEC